MRGACSKQLEGLAKQIARMSVDSELLAAPKTSPKTGAIRVVFAPDYRTGNNYQEDLARALVDEQIVTQFLSHYRLGLPLYRGLGDFKGVQALHLHWPEAYLHSPAWWRKMRFAADLSMAIRRRPLFLTAHNLFPHNRENERFMRSVIRHVVRSARPIFVHSARASELYMEEFGATAKQCRRIPVGDHSQPLGPPLSRSEARERLELSTHDRICLMFGTISPYKGQEQVISIWKRLRLPARLFVVGTVIRKDYADKLRLLCEGASNVSLQIGDWLSPAELRLWLSAADAVVFNYQAILTSGAGCLARAYGLPILFPAALDAVDLGEPHASVLRFHHLEEDFPALVEQASNRGLRYGEAAAYREESRWERVALQTARVYREFVT